MTIWKTKWGWRARFIKKGRYHTAKGFFQYKEEARQWAKDEKKKVGENLKKSSLESKDISLWAISQKYLVDCKVNLSKKTLDEKKYCMERFYKFTGDLDVTDVEPTEVLEFVNLRAKTQSNNAANKDRKNLKAFYGWVQEIYGIMYDPTAPIKKKAHSKEPRRLIPIQDILKVMMAAKGHDRVLIGTYWHTGARLSEAFRLIWDDDINFEERWVRLGTKKNKDGSMQYEKLWMNDDLYNLLMWQWKHRHPTSPYVFCHIHKKKIGRLDGKPFTQRRKLIKELCKKAKVKEFGYHDIRHTVAKYLNDLQKVGLKKVQQVMRHRRQSTTEIYVEGNYTDTKEVMTLLEESSLKNLPQIVSVIVSVAKKRT